MTTAKTTFTADGVPYELTDERLAEESANQFVLRHFERVSAFIELLGEEIDNLKTVVGK